MWKRDKVIYSINWIKAKQKRKNNFTTQAYRIVFGGYESYRESVFHIGSENEKL